MSMSKAEKVTKVERVTIADYLFRKANVEGEVGIEVEVEGEGLPTSSSSLPYWDITRDGSLRGEAYEYVLKKPIKREAVPEAISQLYNKLNKCKVLDSGRAGVHVHINIRDLDIQELFSFILLYLVFEDVLIELCGEDRKGNLFCLRADDAEFILIKIRELFSTIGFESVSNDRIRYSGINLTAIKKYGSLEFRSLPSPVSEELLNTWTKLLLKLKDKAIAFRDPRLIVTGVSEYGGNDFAGSVFEDLLKFLPCDNWNRAVMRGMRKIQPLVQSIDFEQISLVEKKVVKAYEKQSKESDGLAALLNAHDNAVAGWTAPRVVHPVRQPIARDPEDGRFFLADGEPIDFQVLDTVVFRGEAR